MRKVLRAFVGAALSLCLVGALAVAGTAKSPKGASITNGDFAVKLVEAMRMKAPQGGFNQASAMDALAAIGVKLGNASEPLTEARLVGALAALGVSVRSSDPARSVMTDKADRVLSTFGRELTKASASAGIAAAGNGNDDFNNGNGKGGKFKRKANLSPGAKDE